MKVIIRTCLVTYQEYDTDKAEEVGFSSKEPGDMAAQLKEWYDNGDMDLSHICENCEVHCEAVPVFHEGEGNATD
jgi:hypothetical protein